jgi:cytochrome c peroxidase
MQPKKLIASAVVVWAFALLAASHPTTISASTDFRDDRNLDSDLAAVLSAAGFTGDIETTFQDRLRENLGRPIDQKLADLGRLLWFDNAHSLHKDNTCGGCHSPSNGFGDTQPMAIGVQSNGIVGPNRAGPRNQRRTPLVVNTALAPALMWNGRFKSLAGDPFDNSLGFKFPLPEDDDKFSFAENVIHHLTHLLQAQAQMPPTELTEVAGYTGTCPNGIPDVTLGPRFCQFDDGLGVNVPLPDPTTMSRDEPIRDMVGQILDGIPEYRKLFGQVFPEVRDGAPIDVFMFGKAIAEFEFTLVFANAPIDRFARGQTNAMTDGQKRGALLFFGKAQCSSCHSVSGRSAVGTPNELFSDFEEHVIGVPQIAPAFGVGQGNTIFDGPGEDEDFGLEQISHETADRYRFRTAPLRNLALAPAFFHNGAFTRIEDAIRHHLDVYQSARNYDPIKAGVPADLAFRLGPIEPVLDRLDPLLRTPILLEDDEFADLVSFVKEGLLDDNADPKKLCRLIPSNVPSGLPMLTFETCDPIGGSLEQH